MSGANHLVLGLCYVHQQLLHQAHHAFHDEIAAFLPELSDPEQDLDKRMAELLSDESLGRNAARLAGMTLYEIKVEEGATICKFKALLNILFSAANLLNSLKVTDLSQLIEAITTISVPNAAEILSAPERFNIIYQAMTSQNYQAFKKLKGLWSGMADTSGINAIMAIYANWLHLSGEDFVSSGHQTQRLISILRLFLTPIKPFFAELERAMNLDQGSITDLLGLTTSEEVAAQVDAPDRLSKPDPLLVYGQTLLDIESGAWFAADGGADAAADSGLVALNAKIFALHQSCVRTIKSRFHDDIARDFGPEQLNERGYFCSRPEETLPAQEAKKFLNCLWKCHRTLDKLQGRHIPIVTWVQVLINFFKLFDSIKAIRFHDVLQAYIERVNDLLRDTLQGFNPVLALIVCEIEKFEIDNALKKGFIADKISLDEICKTFIKMSIELGPSVDTLPAYIPQLSFIFQQYKESLTEKQGDYAVFAAALEDDIKQLERGQYRLLTAFEKHDLQRIVGNIQGLPVNEELKAPYLSQLEHAIAAPKTAANNQQYRCHGALDNFLKTQRSKLQQLAIQCAQKIRQLDARAQLTHDYQLHLATQESLTIEAVRETRIFRAVLLREQAVLVKIRQFLSTARLSSYQLGHQSTTPPKGVAAIQAILEGNITLANCHQKAVEIRALLDQKLFEGKQLRKRPSTRHWDVQRAYQDIYRELLKARWDEVSLRNASLPEQLAATALTETRAADAPPQTMKRQSQAYLVYLHAVLVNFVTKWMNPHDARQFGELKSWFAEHVLTRPFFDYISRVTQDELDTAIANMSVIAYQEPEDAVLGQVKALLNTTRIFTVFARSVTQKSIDQMLGALNNAVSAYENTDLGFFGKFQAVGNQGAFALICLSYELDHNGWRALLTELNISLHHFSEESLAIMRQQYTSFYKDTTQARQALNGIFQAFLSKAGIRAGVIDRLRKQTQIKSHEGFQLPIPHLVQPACKYAFFGAQELAKMEMGRRALAQEDWTGTPFSQQIHQTLQVLQQFLKFLSRQLFNETVAARIEEALPHVIGDETPQPLREILLLTNIAHHADLLIREVTSSGIDVAKIWRTHRHYTQVTTDVRQMQYQAALQAIAIELNDMIGQALVPMDTIIKCLEMHLRQLEDKQHIRMGLLDQRLGFADAKRRFHDVYSLYESRDKIPAATELDADVVDETVAGPLTTEPA